MITVDNLVRKYGDYTAVDQVSFTIAPGEIVGLLGHNGAGKTTIMKMLTGYLQPTGGSITVDTIDAVARRREVQGRIGYLPENCPVYPEMSVVSYLEYGAALHGISPEHRADSIRRAIERTALAEKADQTIATLSRGYRQRTGVALAILHNPDILVLDEPTNGLDPTQILQMRELIRELAGSATVLISTHILQEVQAVCDRVIIVARGRKVLDSRIDALQDRSSLRVEIGDGTEAEHLGLLQSVDGVETVEKEMEGGAADHVVYTIRLTQEARRSETSAAVARAVHEKNWPLYSLAFERRNLETVFAQASAQ